MVPVHCQRLRGLTSQAPNVVFREAGIPIVDSFDTVDQRVELEESRAEDSCVVFVLGRLVAV